MDKNAVKYHNELASDFEKNYILLPQFEERCKLFVKEIKMLSSSKDKILDLGCGPGIIAATLIQEGFDIYAVDGSQNMIELAKNNTKSSKIFQLNIPFDPTFFSSKFNLIYSSSVFEYLERFDEAIEMTKSLLETNGYFLISMPNKSSFYRKLEQIVFFWTKKPAYLNYSKNRQNAERLIKKMEENGFEYKKIEYFGYKFSFQSFLNKIGLKAKYNANLYLCIFKKN